MMKDREKSSDYFNYIQAATWIFGMMFGLSLSFTILGRADLFIGILSTIATGGLFVYFGNRLSKIVRERKRQKSINN